MDDQSILHYLLHRADGTQQGRNSFLRLQVLAFSLDSIMSLSRSAFYVVLALHHCYQLFQCFPNTKLAATTNRKLNKRLKSCVNRFYSSVNVKVIFQNTRRIKSFFPYKDRLNRSQFSKVIYKASCEDCNDFYIGKTKRGLHDWKTEHFKALSKHDQALLQLLITLKKKLLTTSNGTILTF